MKKMIMVVCFVLTLAVPVSSYALLGVVNIEAAAGGWYATPSGNMKYRTSNSSDLKDVFGFDNEGVATGRLKVDLPVIPVIYLMATPMEFKGDAKQGFTFNNRNFTTNANTKLTFNQYDLALYYGVPFLGLATLGSVHVNGGINVRMIDAKADMTQSGVTENKNLSIPLPMLYLSADIKPTDLFAIEAEVRALSVGYGSVLSAIARLRLNAVGPFFVTAGYRYEDMSVDKDDFKADIKLRGPFAELGLDF
ncbi:MAG: TIGR04219 family outer membrane beta-barrel protein [Desulfobacteraceae bacterium]|nr:TIGR04219 family outer membrane beta-barrel protein [Desulfobacteraceae bacterium]